MLHYFVIACIAVYAFKYLFFPKKVETIANKHILVTGGSSGIGKSVAVLAAKRGAHVTIIARNLNNLALAVSEIKSVCVDPNQKIQSFALDVTDYLAVERVFNEIEEAVGPVYMLVNCAGIALCGKLEDMPFEHIKIVVDTNFFGTVYPTKALVQKFKRRKSGIIVITASQAALVGIFGLSAYAGSKFALRGFAEALDMEVNAYDIGVTLVLPPDTDTPGFENENKSKPAETMLICESGGLHKPDMVAKQLLDDALKRKFFSYLGFESHIMTTLCAGMTRSSSVLETVFQVMVMGLLRIIGLFYLSSFHNTIKKFALKH